MQAGSPFFAHVSETKKTPTAQPGWIGRDDTQDAEESEAGD